MKIVGIDLAAKETNPTGLAILDDSNLKTLILYTDKQILQKIFDFRPSLVGIDAPITKQKGPWRPAEKELLKRGFRPLPLNLKSMRELSRRAYRLTKKIESERIEVIETFHQAIRKILKVEKIDDLKKFKFRLSVGKSKHELDACLIAITCHLYLIEKTESLGIQEKIIIPKPE